MIAALLLLAAAPADDLDCANAQAQQVMNMCEAREAEQADAALNRQWQATSAAMKDRDREIDRSYDKEPGYFDTLLAGQRAWLTFRDKQCLLQSFEMRGGSAAPMLYSGCMATLTRERTQHLKALIETGN